MLRKGFLASLFAAPLALLGTRIREVGAVADELPVVTSGLAQTEGGQPWAVTTTTNCDGLTVWYVVGEDGRSAKLGQTWYVR